MFGIYRTKYFFVFFFSLGKLRENKPHQNLLFSLSFLVNSAWLSAVIEYNIGYTVCTWKMVYNVIEMNE